MYLAIFYTNFMAIVGPIWVNMDPSAQSPSVHTPNLPQKSGTGTLKRGIFQHCLHHCSLLIAYSLL